MTVVEPSVPRLAEILAGNPYLNPGAPDVIDVDGFSGLSLDIGVPTYAECSLPYVLIWAIPVGEGGEIGRRNGLHVRRGRGVAVGVDGRGQIESAGDHHSEEHGRHEGRQVIAPDIHMAAHADEQP